MQYISNFDPLIGVQHCYHSTLSESAARNKNVFEEIPVE
jgi:hypothetical protein